MRGHHTITVNADAYDHWHERYLLTRNNTESFSDWCERNLERAILGDMKLKAFASKIKKLPTIVRMYT